MYLFLEFLIAVMIVIAIMIIISIKYREGYHKKSRLTRLRLKREIMEFDDN